MKYKYPIVEIIWRDAECDASWAAVKEIKEEKLPMIQALEEAAIKYRSK